MMAEVTTEAGATKQMQVHELRAMATWLEQLEPVYGYVELRGPGIRIRLYAPASLFPDGQLRATETTVPWDVLIDSPEEILKAHMQAIGRRITHMIDVEGKARPLTGKQRIPA
ncbi:MAG: hypothetical protein ACR2QF_03030 [Geminicoccaceae bacterium]